MTKSEVNQYRGEEIPDWERLGLDPNRIYDVLRPAEEIEASLEQMCGLPILNDHDDVHDAAHPQKEMRIGAMGTNPEFNEPEVTCELTFWNKKEIDDIQTKRCDNLSMGYDYTAVLENGSYNGKKYKVRMKDIVWNHVALVDKGRVDGAKVSDSAFGTRKKLPMAGSETGDKNMATKKKRNGDAVPAGGEGEEEIKENRVIAGLKALAAEFDNIHQQEGIDPGMTDDEQAAFQKVQDFLGGFGKSEDKEPGMEAGTGIDPMDEDPELAAGDEEEEEVTEGGEDEKWEDIEKPKSPTGDKKKRSKGMDAAMIEQKITAKFKAKDRALDDCEELVGSVSKARVLDSAMDVYVYALKTNGIEIPKGVNLEGLRGMVTMLKKSRVGDSIQTFTKPTGVEASIQEAIIKSPYAPRY